MHIEKMSPQEITYVIFDDLEFATKSLVRFSLQYDTERMKYNISEDLQYSKSYKIKTAAKLRWIFIIGKAPTIEKYKGIESVNVFMLVYLNNSNGLRVFKLRSGDSLEVYNGNLFKQYKESLGLTFSSPIETINHFFINNAYSFNQIFVKEGKKLAISVCKDGLMLGEIQEHGKWLVNKTFISKTQAKINIIEMEKDLIDSLQSEIEEEIKKNEFDKVIYDKRASIFKGIIPTKYK